MPRNSVCESWSLSLAGKSHFSRGKDDKSDEIRDDNVKMKMIVIDMRSAPGKVGEVSKGNVRNKFVPLNLNWDPLLFLYKTFSCKPCAITVIIVTKVSFISSDYICINTSFDLQTLFSKIKTFIQIFEIFNHFTSLFQCTVFSTVLSSWHLEDPHSPNHCHHPTLTLFAPLSHTHTPPHTPPHTPTHTHLSGCVLLPQLDQHQLVDPLADDDDYVKEEGDNLKIRWCPMMMIMQNL